MTGQEAAVNPAQPGQAAGARERGARSPAGVGGAGADTGRAGTRERIFRAAVAEFAAKGYAGATVRGVCARAGANLAAVNYHFGSKERLYAAVLDLVMDSPGETAARAAARPGSVEERLRAYVLAFVRNVYAPRPGYADGDLAAVYLSEMARPSASLDRVVEARIRPDAQALGDLLREHLGPGADRDTVMACAVSLVGQMLAYCSFWPILERLHPGLGPQEGWVEQFAEHVYRFSLGGLAATRAALPAAPGAARTFNPGEDAP
jgi:TetR/AcrR family transcriptional regulator, regulator of cefoperazone and chloramphenicol sensitivity